MLTTVWYPTDTADVEQAWTIGIFRMGFGVPNAPLPPIRRRPLVLLSHGTGGAAAQLSWLAETFAARGYIAAAVSHHANTAAESRPLPHGFALWWERAQDLSAVLDHLAADPELGPHIDPARIAAAGFSLGGYTVLALAGARVDLERYTAYCADHADEPGCALPPEAGFDRSELLRLATEDEAFKTSRARSGESYRDVRIKAVAAIAPVLAQAIDPASLASIRTPSWIAVGEADGQAKGAAETYRRHMAESVPLTFKTLPKVGHYTFLARCTWRGAWVVPALCRDGSGVDRAAVHASVANEIEQFIASALP